MSRLFCLEGDVLQECGELLGGCLTCEELVGVTWRVADCEELVGVNHTTESVTDLFSFVELDELLNLKS